MKGPAHLDVELVIEKSLILAGQDYETSKQLLPLIEKNAQKLIDDGVVSFSGLRDGDPQMRVNDKAKYGKFQNDMRGEFSRYGKSK